MHGDMTTSSDEDKKKKQIRDKNKHDEQVLSWVRHKRAGFYCAVLSPSCCAFLLSFFVNRRRASRTALLLT
jgi:hypothetical protein